MTGENSCYFFTPGKFNSCGILNGPCSDDTKKNCKFRKSEAEYIEARNKAVELNRKRGNCAKCKYKPYPCEIVVIKGDMI